MQDTLSKHKIEVDRLDFKDTATGYTCALRRNNLGVWCGYVKIPATHALHGVSHGDKVKVPKGWHEDRSLNQIGVLNALCSSFSEENLDTIELSAYVCCHEGLTWSGNTVETGVPSGYNTGWWLGFDCGHFGDFVPSVPTGGKYRDMDYVVKCLLLMCLDLQSLENTTVVSRPPQFGFKEW